MKWLSFYSGYFNNLAQRAKQNVGCLFHDDKEPSLSLDLETGLFYCHACREGGDVFSFYMKYHNCSFSKAKVAIVGSEKAPYLTETEIKVAQGNLLSSDILQKMLLVKRGWIYDTIKKFNLGWKDERVFIPIYEDGVLKNIRKYDVMHQSKHKFLGIEGCNDIRIWPESSMRHDWVLVMAGEPDTILANQLGMPAVTFTGGEGAFNANLLPAFKGKKVFLCFDPDRTGKTGALKLAHALKPHSAETKIINLTEEMGDFTDFFLKCADDGTDFTATWNPLVENATVFDVKEEIEEEAVEIDFHSAVKDEFYGKNIKFKAIAIGKALSPFFAPKKISIKCSFTRGESCKECRLFLTGGEHEINIKDEQLLEFIGISNSQQRDKIKGMAGIKGCQQFETKIDTQTIEQIFISPIIDSERIDRHFSVRKVYTESHDIGLNKIYNFVGKTIPDPKTQEATHLFHSQTPELTDLDKFTLVNEDIERLKLIFNPIFSDDKETMENKIYGIEYKMYHIQRDLSYNVPEIIVGREELMIAYDLTFHSVLRFKVFSSMIEKGWVEMLALGDTRTGKTKTATKMCKHYKVGEYVTLESATIPGLIGGMTQMGRESAFSWGVLPINNGRLVIFDEVNGLETKEIGNLSSIRDNGIAERTVVGSVRKTTARVRMIWLSNPRSLSVAVSHYSSGVEAIRELIGRAEDISRFDFAIIVAKEDVDLMDINTKGHGKVDHIYTSELCNKCIMWAWSRKPEHVHFTPGAEQAILARAIEMAQKYSDTIPLVQGSVQRIKLAKLSVALACRLFSTEDGVNVIVKEEHVQFVHKFLVKLYDSPYFGYEDYSQNKQKESKIGSESEVITQLLALRHTPFIDKMLAMNNVLFDDIRDFSKLDKDSASKLRGLLVSNNCLKRYKSYYIKTPEFVRALKKVKAHLERSKDDGEDKSDS